jgi:hypothetical protein
MPRITTITYHDMFGIDAMEVAFRSILLIEGGNGTGKSSMIRSLAYIIDGGHDPDVIRVGAEFGECIIKFDDKRTFRVRVTPSGTTREVRNENNKPEKRAKEYIESVVNALSFDPMRFVEPHKRSKKEDDEYRLEEVLKLSSLVVTPDDLKPILGRKPNASECAGNGLDVIQKFYDEIYKRRTDVNRDEDIKRKHGQQMLSAAGGEIPAPEDIEELRARLEAERKAVADGERAAEKAAQAAELEVARDCQRLVATVAAVIHGSTDALKDEAERRIEEIRKKLQADIEKEQNRLQSEADAIRKDADTRATAVRAKFTAQAEAARQAHAPAIESLIAEITEKEARARRYHESEAHRKIGTDAIAEADNLKVQADTMTAALRSLAELKTKLMGNIPIPGVTIEGGKIYWDVDGAPVRFDLLNTQRKVLFALRIGVLTHGAIGVICMDNFEALEPENRKGVIRTAFRYAQSEGMQFGFARVTVGPLKLTSIATEEDLEAALEQIDREAAVLAEVSQ